MAILHFSKEEQLILENNILKEQNLSMQIQSLQNERQTFINDYCKRNSRDPKTIKGVDAGTGIIEFTDEEPKEKKKRSK